MILNVTTKVRCPHCGKNLTIKLDPAAPEEIWIEECEICRQAIHFSSIIREGRLAVTAEQSK